MKLSHHKKRPPINPSKGKKNSKQLSESFSEPTDSMGYNSHLVQLHKTLNLMEGAYRSPEPLDEFWDNYDPSMILSHVSNRDSHTKKSSDFVAHEDSKEKLKNIQNKENQESYNSGRSQFNSTQKKSKGEEQQTLTNSEFLQAGELKLQELKSRLESMDKKTLANNRANIEVLGERNKNQAKGASHQKSSIIESKKSVLTGQVQSIPSLKLVRKSSENSIKGFNTGIQLVFASQTQPLENGLCENTIQLDIKEYDTTTKVTRKYLDDSGGSEKKMAQSFNASADSKKGQRNSIEAPKFISTSQKTEKNIENSQSKAEDTLTKSPFQLKLTQTTNIKNRQNDNFKITLKQNSQADLKESKSNCSSPKKKLRAYYVSSRSASKLSRGSIKYVSPRKPFVSSLKEHEELLKSNFMQKSYYDKMSKSAMYNEMELSRKRNKLLKIKIEKLELEKFNLVNLNSDQCKQIVGLTKQISEFKKILEESKKECLQVEKSQIAQDNS